MSSQTEREIVHNNMKIERINKHIKSHKKDHSARIALMKTVARLRKNKRYLSRNNKKA